MSIFIHVASENVCAKPKIYLQFTIRAIVYVICLPSLMLCAKLCLTCGIWYVVYSVLYATFPDPFMIYPLCYVACVKAFMLCLKMHLYASIHS